MDRQNVAYDLSMYESLLEPRPKKKEEPKHRETKIEPIETKLEAVDEDTEQDVADFDEEQADEIAHEQASQTEAMAFNTKVDLGDTSVPPFLRKLKKKK